jgi:hypothetical protein
MIALYIFFRELIHRIRRGWGDPEFRGLFWTVLAVLAGGTVYYHFREGWSWVDAFYFCVVTLATVGYGDFAPTTTETRLFTVVYIIIGLGLLSSFILKLADVRVTGGETRPLRRFRRTATEVEEQVEANVESEDNTNP